MFENSQFTFFPGADFFNLHLFLLQASIDMIKARYYQTILSYEVTQHLLNSRKFVAKEAFNTGEGSYKLIKDLPFGDFLRLIEYNIPMIFNFAIAVNTDKKVSKKVLFLHNHII